MSVKEYTQVIFLMSEWSIDPRRYLYKELIEVSSKWSNFLLVQQPVCLAGHFFTRFKQKIIGLLRGKYKNIIIGEGVHLFTPVIIFNYSLWVNFGFLASIDIFLLRIQLNSYLRKHFNDTKKIYWVFFPKLLPFLKKEEYDLLVYDFQDNYDYEPDGRESCKVSDFNTKLIEKSDLVFCTASIMFERASRLNHNSYLIPNGNDFQTLVRMDNKEIRTEIDDFGKPIVGYLGNFKAWIDAELLDKLIVQFPEVQFVFIGPVHRYAKSHLRNLLMNENVTWIDFKDQEVLPYYLKNFTIAILPMKLNRFMDGVFPNKFFEYMASGIPIVTTALPELEKYSDIIGFSRSHEEFLSNVQSALNGEFSERVKVYRRLASENTWWQRALQIDKILRNRLELDQAVR